MYDREQLLFAFFSSPLTLPFMWAAWALYGGVSIGEVQMGVGFVFAPAAYLSAAAFGAPMFLLCQALGWKNVLPYVSGGVIMGSVTGLILGLLFGGMDFLIALCMAAGASSGLVCWLILVRPEMTRRPPH